MYPWFAICPAREASDFGGAGLGFLGQVRPRKLAGLAAGNAGADWGMLAFVLVRPAGCWFVLAGYGECAARSARFVDLKRFAPRYGSSMPPHGASKWKLGDYQTREIRKL